MGSENNFNKTTLSTPSSISDQSLPLTTIYIIKSEFLSFNSINKRLQ